MQNILAASNVVEPPGFIRIKRPRGRRCGESLPRHLPHARPRDASNRFQIFHRREATWKSDATEDKRSAGRSAGARLSRVEAASRQRLGETAKKTMEADLRELARLPVNILFAVYLKISYGVV
jgi:hypothetical protein